MSVDIMARSSLYLLDYTGRTDAGALHTGSHSTYHFHIAPTHPPFHTIFYQHRIVLTSTTACCAMFTSCSWPVVCKVVQRGSARRPSCTYAGASTPNCSTFEKRVQQSPPDSTIHTCDEMVALSLAETMARIRSEVAPGHPMKDNELLRNDTRKKKRTRRREGGGMSNLCKHQAAKHTTHAAAQKYA